MKIKKLISVWLATTLLILSVSVYSPANPTVEAYTTTEYGRNLCTIADFIGSGTTSYEDPKVEVGGCESYEYVDEALDGSSGNFLKCVRNNTGNFFIRVNMSGKNQVDYSTALGESNLALAIRVYIRDPRFFTFGEGQVEIASNDEGTYDKQEWYKRTLDITYKAGWNTIILPLDDPTSVMEDWIFGKLTYFRLYLADFTSELQSGSRTVYFDYVKLMWYPDSAVTEQTLYTNIGEGQSILSWAGSNAGATPKEIKTYAEQADIFDPDSPNQLLLADFREATVSGSTLTNVKSVGSNTGIENVYPGRFTTQTVIATVGRATLTNMKSKDAYNYLFDPSTPVTSDDQAKPLPRISSDGHVEGGYYWTVKVNFGGYVDLSRYTKINFSFWMTNYYDSKLPNGESSVVAGTPGTLFLNLQDSAEGSSEDGVNFPYYLENARYDATGNRNSINCGHIFTYHLYEYYSQSESAYTSAKTLRTDMRKKDTENAYRVSPKQVDGLFIRFYVNSSETGIKQAPTIYLGQVWASCDSDTVEPSCAVSGTLDGYQTVYMMQQPSSYDPLTNWDGKQNKSVTVTDWNEKQRIFITGLVLGDYRHATANHAWPWRYDLSMNFGKWNDRTVRKRGGAIGIDSVRKNEKWLTHNSIRVYGGASGKATAANLTSTQNLK